MMRRIGLLVTWLGCAALVVRLHPGSGGLPSSDVAGWIARDPEHAIAVAAAAAGWLLAAWLVLVLGLVLVAETAASASALGRCAERLLRRLAPAFVRQAARSILGTVLVLAPAGPALAAASPAATAVAYAQSLPPVPAPLVAPPERLPSLDWPLTALGSGRPAELPPVTAPQPPPTAPQPSPSPPPHCVQSGDTLWALAAAELPPAATGAEITAAWQQIYAANRSVIGSDPALLLPGQLLVIPEALR
jgi:hypothetical protein